MKTSKIISVQYNKVKDCIENGSPEKLRHQLDLMKMSDIAAVLNRLPDEQKAKVFEQLSDSLALKLFKIIPFKTRQAVMKNMHYEKAAHLLNILPDDDRVAFFQDLPSRVVNELLKVLDDKERKDTLTILGYPEGSVGRLMTPHYIAVKKEWSVRDVFDYIRTSGKNSETVNVIYVVDDNGVLIDDIRIREFLFADPVLKVSDVMDYQFLFLSTKDKQEEAIQIFRKNNRFALPVIDDKGILLGIVTIDDILRLAESETTRDVQKIGGSEALDEPYTQISFTNLIRKRAGWLIILFLGEMLTATAMAYFEGELNRALVLALFIPLIISSGGNSGSQASTIIIRAMALGEVKLKNWFYVMRKEILSGLSLGIILGIVGFCRILLWHALGWGQYTEHWFLVAVTVGLSLIGIVMWGTLSGSMLPLLLKKAGADPAASSAPFVATLVDVTGLIIYFSIAYLVLHNTLLK